ncbi:MAG TPA: hypothetical protein VN689_10190, partial [Burkholderiales bacterium]|nr:hypothetical protein [Burkholderiales bacterium]
MASTRKNIAIILQDLRVIRVRSHRLQIQLLRGKEFSASHLKRRQIDKIDPEIRLKLKSTLRSRFLDCKILLDSAAR